MQDFVLKFVLGSPSVEGDDDIKKLNEDSKKIGGSAASFASKIRSLFFAAKSWNVWSVEPNRYSLVPLHFDTVLFSRSFKDYNKIVLFKLYVFIAFACIGNFHQDLRMRVQATSSILKRALSAPVSVRLMGLEICSTKWGYYLLHGSVIIPKTQKIPCLAHLRYICKISI